MKAAIFLGCHNRLKDLSVHLDICQWTGLPAYVIFTGSGELNHPEPIRKLTPPHYRDGNQGASFALMESLRWAAELGLDKIIYRNCDDWILNRKWAVSNLEHNVNFMGYNWLGHNNDREFAINENVMEVKVWEPTLHIGKKCFDSTSDCEHGLGCWRREISASWERLGLSRESDGGIGLYTDDPTDWDSSRWFNMRWGLLGHHDMVRKHQRYMQLRYAYHDSMGLVHGLEGLEELEKLPRFSTWLAEMKL
jgi:hypothetical protein